MNTENSNDDSLRGIVEKLEEEMRIMKDTLAKELFKMN